MDGLQPSEEYDITEFQKAVWDDDCFTYTIPDHIEEQIKLLRQQHMTYWWNQVALNDQAYNVTLELGSETLPKFERVFIERKRKQITDELALLRSDY